MSELARRIADGVTVKIGTCEDMYYLRYEDRFSVKPIPGNVNPVTDMGLRFRLPFPDEDGIPVGNYEPFERGTRLFSFDTDEYDCPTTVDYYDADLADDPGKIQVHHESGVLFCIPCYHGIQLPEIEGLQFHWSGKTHSIELCQVKNTKSGIVPIIRCRHCGEKWRATWAEIWDYIQDDELKNRLSVHWSPPQAEQASAA